MLINNAATMYGGINTYIILVWLFFILNTFIMLLLCYLDLSIRKTREQEQLNREFSNLMIEGLETERRRIYRELHDTVLPQIRGTEVWETIRSICVNLMPPDFSHISLTNAIAQLCMQFSSKTGIECACYIEESLDFSQVKPEAQLHIYRIIQESFNNIEKHSGAARSSLVARYNPQGNILICVSDEGAGLKNKQEGLGMKSIRQRAAIIGAKLNFISESGNGLMVRIEAPLTTHLSTEHEGL